MTTSAGLIHPVNLGPLGLANNLVLAPMHKRTHMAFRLICRRAGAALAHTEMATPEDLLGLGGPRKGGNILATCPEEQPLGVQLLPKDEGPMLEALALLREKRVGDLVDLNFACPSKRVAGGGRGAAFLKKPEAAVRLIEAAVRAVAPVPVTIKIRRGWTDSPQDLDRAMDLARGAVAAGIAGLTLHGRTAAQLYHDTADWGAIGRWVEALAPLPVFGSGDLRSPEAVLDMLRQTGAAGAHLARGVTGAPWVFRQVMELAATGTYAEVTMAERARDFWEHYEGLVAQYGTRIGLRYICQVGRMYTRGIPLAAEARVAIQNAGGPEDLRMICKTYFSD